MSNTFNNCWFICLLIIGIHALTIHSYGDVESLNDDNDADTSKRDTFESVIKSMHVNHRAKRLVGAQTTDTFQVTTQSSTTTNSSAIYIITDYTDPSATTELTTYTVQTSQITSISTNTNSMTNGTYVITAFYSFMTTTTTTTTTATTTISSPCDNGTYVTLANGTCDSRLNLIYSALNTLNSSSANDTQKANALTTYITAITNSNLTLNSSNSLTVGQIDGILGSFNSSNYTVSTNNSIIVITKPNCYAATTIIGASFELINGPTVINTQNMGSVTNSMLSSAGVVNFTGQCSVSQFNVLIISNPTTYRTADNSTNSTVVSSIVMATIGTANSTAVNVNVQLYFQDLTGSKPSDTGIYSCAFYDTRSLRWNQSGCSAPLFNAPLNRYECSCNHLTSFALIWLPMSVSSPNGQPPSYNAQDKASIAFQAISILCFLGIIIHAITVRIMRPQDFTQIRHLLPIISCGVTMILFIFYIALGLTVYTRRSQSPTNNQTSNSSSSYIPCSSTEHGLMFVVYFFIIFMFCSKTSIGIDNYRRYVHVFNVPSYQMLSIAMGISVLVSGIWLAFAAGFDSNPSNEITEIYQDKLCWFNHTVNNYFLTIPVCLFLAINLALFIPVVKHSITHVHSAEEKVDYCIRRKRCMYVLLASASTQGFGWLFGPVISVASPEAANVLGWFFIIFNGLEGLWAVLIYIIVEKEGLNDARRRTDYITEQQKYDDDDDDDEDRIDLRLDNLDSDRRHDPLTNARSDSPRHSFADLPGVQSINWPDNNIS